MSTKPMHVEPGDYADNLAALDVALMMLKAGLTDDALSRFLEVRQHIQSTGEVKSTRALLPRVNRAIARAVAGQETQVPAHCPVGAGCTCGRSWEGKALRAVLAFLFVIDLAAVVGFVLLEISGRVKW